MFRKALLMTTLIVLVLGTGFARAAMNPASPVSPVSGQDGHDLVMTLPVATAMPIATPTPALHRLVAINAQKTRVAAVTASAVMIWGLDTGNMIAKYDICGHAITDIAFSPDGLSVAASVSDGAVLVWAAP